jgi:hypothetical protein
MGCGPLDLYTLALRCLFWFMVPLFGLRFAGRVVDGGAVGLSLQHKQKITIHTMHTKEKGKTVLRMMVSVDVLALYKII